MFERFTSETRAAVTTHAQAEARRRGDRRIGTEHLLLGVLHDPVAARHLGTDLAAVRATLAALDDTALSAIGLDTSGTARSAIPAPTKRTPFSSGAKTTLSRAVAAARHARARQITTTHLLLGLLDGDHTDPATEVLTALAVNPAAVRARLDRDGRRGGP